MFSNINVLVQEFNTRNNTIKLYLQSTSQVKKHTNSNSNAKSKNTKGTKINLKVEENSLDVKPEGTY